MPQMSHSVLRRHARWVLPLVAAPAVYVGAILGFTSFEEGLGPEPTAGDGLLALALLALALLGPVVLLLIALVRAVGVGREARLRAGRFTSTERAVMAQQAAAQESATVAWRYAIDTARAIARGEQPPTVAVWDVVPLPGEMFHADVPIGYARYYGTTAQAHQTSGLFVGHPAFVIAGLAGTALVNASARSAAQRQAADQWREHGTVRLVVSDQRLLVQRNGQWIGFHHSGLTAVYPDPERRGLVCQYHDASPLMLQGDWGPLAAVVVVATTHGPPALMEHPAMEPIAAVVRTGELPSS